MEIYGSTHTLALEVTVDDWDHLWNVNVQGTMLCYQHAAKQMVKVCVTHIPGDAELVVADQSTHQQGRGGRLIGDILNVTYCYIS